jgi:hypothetical protein
MQEEAEKSEDDDVFFGQLSIHPRSRSFQDKRTRPELRPVMQLSDAEPISIPPAGYADSEDSKSSRQQDLQSEIQALKADSPVP